MTGRKPVTANHLHLRPRTDSSGVKAHIGRELQPSPNLCVLLPRLQTTLPHLCLNSQLSWLLHFTLFFCVFFWLQPRGIIQPPLLPINKSLPHMPPSNSFPVSPHPRQTVYSRHSDFSLKRAHFKRETHQRFIHRSHLNHGLRCSWSQRIRFVLFFALLLLFAALSMYFASLHLWI